MPSKDISSLDAVRDIHKLMKETPRECAVPSIHPRVRNAGEAPAVASMRPRKERYEGNVVAEEIEEATVGFEIEYTCKSWKVHKLAMVWGPGVVITPPLLRMKPRASVVCGGAD